jgi:hypothetical protein
VFGTKFAIMRDGKVSVGDDVAVTAWAGQPTTPVRLA